MPSDYATISAENTVKYGTEVSYYGIRRRKPWHSI